VKSSVPVKVRPDGTRQRTKPRGALDIVERSTGLRLNRLS
jgi:hypothetical protein